MTRKFASIEKLFGTKQSINIQFRHAIIGLNTGWNDSFLGNYNNDQSIKTRQQSDVDLSPTHHMFKFKMGPKRFKLIVNF